MKPATADSPFLMDEPPAGRGFDPAALLALFILTLRQIVHGKRLLVISLLFLLPAGLELLLRFAPHPPPAKEVEFVFVFNFIPYALAPLTALLFAASVIQDEVEEQTLTYLLLRPLPRWAMYFVRLAAAWLVASAVLAVFTTLTLAVCWWGTEDLWKDVLPGRALKVAELMALAQVGYCALYGALGLYTRRAVLYGLAYIVAFEGLIGTFGFVARKLTVMYYFRVVAVRWLAPANSRNWNLELQDSDTTASFVWTLLIASAVLILMGMVMTARKEFRMKTPEGN
jgi:ABC-2 type transport system permease protein